MAFSRKPKWWLAAAAALMVLVLGAVMISSGKTPSVAIDSTFSSFKTNATGGRVAVFVVKNNCSFPIERAWFESIDVKTPTGWQTLTNIHNLNRGWGSPLQPGETETAEVLVPMTTNEWRMVFIYGEHLDPVRKFARAFTKVLRSAGLPVEGGGHIYGFPSESVRP